MDTVLIDEPGANPTTVGFVGKKRHAPLHDDARDTAATSRLNDKTDARISTHVPDLHVIRLTHQGKPIAVMDKPHGHSEWTAVRVGRGQHTDFFPG